MILSALKCRQRLGTGGMLVSQIRRQAKTRQGSDANRRDAGGARAAKPKTVGGSPAQSEVITQINEHAPL
jgi:hypothetical protein